MTVPDELLGDFRPALSLLPAAERGRTEAALEEVIRARMLRPAEPRQPTTLAEAEAAAERLAAEFWSAFAGTPPPSEVVSFGGALVRLRALQELGPALAGGRCPLPATAVPKALEEPSPERLVRAVRAECPRLRPRLLSVGGALAALPEPLHAAGAYLLLAALRLLTRLEEADAALLEHPLRLAPWTRSALVARVRWKGLDAV